MRKSLRREKAHSLDSTTHTQPARERKDFFALQRVVPQGQTHENSFNTLGYRWIAVQMRILSDDVLIRAKSGWIVRKGQPKWLNAEINCVNLDFRVRTFAHNFDFYSRRCPQKVWVVSSGAGKKLCPFMTLIVKLLKNSTFHWPTELVRALETCYSETWLINPLEIFNFRGQFPWDKNGRPRTRCWQEFCDVNRIVTMDLKLNQYHKFFLSARVSKAWTILSIRGKCRLKVAHLARQHIKGTLNALSRAVFTPRPWAHVSQRNFPAMNLPGWHFRSQHKAFDYCEAGSPFCTAPTSVNCISEALAWRKFSRLIIAISLEVGKLAILRNWLNMKMSVVTQ